MQAADQSPEEYKKSLTDSLNIGHELGKYLGEIQSASIEVNKVFTQGRQRVSELMTGIADATPRVNRLGGSMKDVAQVMGDVAEASNRNLIASVEETEKLYAAQKILGQQADTLVNSFSDVGVGLAQIPKELENSISYIQSIGGNAKQVMKDVTDNMSQMNRFQFEGGVVGLTKMAAQASMLRFNMGETFRLADKVLDPDGAIEVASAFQRLGVSAGNLVDPFQLMNMSINDPSGLQNSLADVAKQFSYFDEETKTFKINPQGVLTLREMEKQTGVSAQEMSKMAVAAAELDKRLSAVDMAGVTIGSEEDKQFLANIAKMDKSGEYVVQIKDDEGKVQTKNLADITQKEFDKLIEEQKNRPQTMEDIARVQMGISETIKSDVNSIKNSLAGGIISSKQVRENIIGAQKTVDVVGGEASRNFGKPEVVRKETETLFTNLGTFVDDLKSGNKSFTDSLSGVLEKIGNQMSDVEKGFKETLGKYSKDVSSKLPTDNLVGSSVKNVVDKGIEITNNDKVKGVPLENGSKKIAETITQNTQTTITKGTVDVGGKIQVDVQVPTGVSESQLKQILTSTFNESKFKDYIVRLIPKEGSLTPENKTYE
jgi:hypothetical protein